MAYQHKRTLPKWQDYSLLFQMANVGSEVFRALRWRKERNKESARNAFERSLELFDLTMADPKNKDRLSEICRAREAWVDFFAFANEYNSTAEQWEKYFFAFNYAANRLR
jgi:hypothetical protein